MRMYKFAAMAALAFAGAVGVSALAQDEAPPMPPLASVDAFYACNPIPLPPGMPVEVCIEVSNPDLVGRTCAIFDDHGLLITCSLQLGQNYAIVAPTSATITLTGPGIEPKWYNPGSN
jgi:hypothetical protein